MFQESKRFILADGVSTLIVGAEDPVGQVAQKLIQDLCSEMSERYGTPPSPFSPESERAKEGSFFLVAWIGGQPVGCGSLRRLDCDTAELRRMYVAPMGRRQGVARRIISQLEGWALESGYRRIRLETGVLQPEAQRLYESAGYRKIESFGPYTGNPSSVCYEKGMTAL